MFGAAGVMTGCAHGLLSGAALPGHPGLAGRGLQPEEPAGAPAAAGQQCRRGAGRRAGLYRLRPAGAGDGAPAAALARLGLRRRLLSAVLVAALVLRAKGRMPADTAARLAELQARIRPHFLFNSLNSAIALVREDPARAEALLEDLSELFRHALVEQGDSATLAEEVLVPRATWPSKQVRFGERPAGGSGRSTRGRQRARPRFVSAAVGGKCGQARGGTQSDRRGGQGDDPEARQRGGDQGDQHGAGGQGKPGHGVAQDNVATACACCMMCRPSSRRP
jgi:two-component system sensor histidine kinase AlgZ